MRARTIVFLACAGLLATATLAVEYDGRRATFGELVYQRSCAVCHGTGARGSGTAAAAGQSVPAPDLTTLQRRHGGVFPTEYVTGIITAGAGVTVHGGQMPAWGLLFLKDFEGTGGEPSALVKRRIGDLVEYLKKIQVP